MLKKSGYFIWFLAVVCFGSFTNAKEQNQTYLVSNISVVTMEGQEILENQNVLLRDGKIVEIYRAGELRQARDAIVIDGTGKYLSPGLIDAHVHVSLRSDFERYLTHGVTTVREMWGLPRGLRWRKALAEGKFAGPNFVVASTFFWLDGPKTTMHVEPTDPEVGRALVRQAKAEGYDLIKVVSLPDPDILRAVTDEAKQQGLTVSGHYPDRSMPFDTMIDTGMSSFEHADEITSIAFQDDSSDENIKRVAKELAERGIGITTILTPAQNYLEIDEKGKAFYTPEAKLDILLHLGPHYFSDARQTIDNVIAAGGEYNEQWIEGIALSKRAAKIFVEEGVPLAIGTEGIGPFFRVAGVGAHDEMALLSSAGLSNYQVMVVATINGARLTGFEGHKGKVIEGYDADLLILDGNPLEDLSVLENPEAVFVMGRYYSKEDIDDLTAIY